MFNTDLGHHSYNRVHGARRHPTCLTVVVVGGGGGGGGVRGGGGGGGGVTHQAHIPFILLLPCCDRGVFPCILLLVG